MSKKPVIHKEYDYEDRPKAWEKAGYRWNGSKWSKKCLCHDLLWDAHDKFLNAEKEKEMKEWAV